MTHSFWYYLKQTSTFFDLLINTKALYYHIAVARQPQSELVVHAAKSG